MKALEISSWPGRGGGPEAGDARLLQRVGEARLDRHLRPDHHQVGGDLAGQGDQAARPRSALMSRVSPIAAMPGLPGAQTSRVSSGDCGDLPGQRVLAPAGADEEDVHRRWLSRGAHAGVKDQAGCARRLDPPQDLGDGAGTSTP